MAGRETISNLLLAQKPCSTALHTALPQTADRRLLISALWTLSLSSFRRALRDYSVQRLNLT